MALGWKIIKQGATVVEAARRVPWRALRQIDADASLVVWLHHRSPDSWLRWLTRGDAPLKDIALLTAIAETGRPFRVVTGLKIGAVNNSTILYSIDNVNPNRVANYSAALMTTLRQLEAQGNTLFPSADEAEFWENKVFMHRRFDELGIKAPKTVAIHRHSDLATTIAEHGFAFPLLVKEPHSCNSAGLYRVVDLGALDDLRRRLGRTGVHELLLQELLDMRRDLRVTLVGGKVVHHYWRINTGAEWAPTTTRRGSKVDFVTFPEQWRDHIEATIKVLGLRNGAFDVCWDHDDVDTAPYFLEVSPTYTPNPPPPAAFADRPYADFKTQLRGPDAYARRAAEVLIDLHRKIVAAWGF